MFQWVYRLFSKMLSKLFVFRKDPYGIIVGKFPEKISIENNKNVSKLIIKKLELFDSGVYQLYANNSIFEKRISVSLFVKSNNSEILNV